MRQARHQAAACLLAGNHVSGAGDRGFVQSCRAGPAVRLVSSRSEVKDASGIIARHGRGKTSPDIGDRSDPPTRPRCSASLVGTSVEFYDFYIYATAAALVFGPLFFPGESPAAQLLACLCELWPGLCRAAARALRFRTFRRPGRAQIDPGRVADADGRIDPADRFPADLRRWSAGSRRCCCACCASARACGLGGEWGGAALLAVENAPPGWAIALRRRSATGRAGGFPRRQRAVPLLGWAQPDEAFHAWGWRIPFLLSAVLVGLGLWVRLTGSPRRRLSPSASKPSAAAALPFGELLRDHWPATLAGTRRCRVLCLFYISTAFVLGYDDHGTRL